MISHFLSFAKIVTILFEKPVFLFFVRSSIAMRREVNTISKEILFISIFRILSMILKCYVLLDMIDDVEVYYRENFIIPFIEPIITRVLIIFFCS